jgi:hypothetical protein
MPHDGKSFLAKMQSLILTECNVLTDWNIHFYLILQQGYATLKQTQKLSMLEATYFAVTVWCAWESK